MSAFLRAAKKVVVAATGLLALAWFLIRVIPKPSRALYPCQRAAFPLASAFIASTIRRTPASSGVLE